MLSTESGWPASTGLPGTRDLDALTGNRDRVVDLLRIVSLVVVVAILVVRPSGILGHG